jgi:hypothetical protein
MVAVGFRAIRMDVGKLPAALDCGSSPTAGRCQAAASLIETIHVDVSLPAILGDEALVVPGSRENRPPS